MASATGLNRVRAWAALAIGYALLLQLVIAGVVIGQQAAAALTDIAGLAVICHDAAGTPGSDPGSGPKPLHHSPCIGCAFATVSAPAAPNAVVVVFAIMGDVVFAPPADTRRALTRPRTPRSSQGPPQRA